MLAITKLYWVGLHRYQKISWALIATIIAVDALWLLLSDIRFAQTHLPAIAMLAALSMYVSATILKPGWLKTIVDGYAFLCVAWPSLRIFNHLTFTQGGAFIDPALSRVDRAMGLEWSHYAQWVDGYPILIDLLRLSYAGLSGISVVVFIALAILSGRRAEQEFLLLFTGMAIAISALSILFPAEGTMAYYAEASSRLQNLADEGRYHLPYYATLRSDPQPLLVLEDLPRLSTFPSFHTAMGVLLVYCSRERLILFVPAVLYSATMIAATPIFGSHHFIDLIAGAATTLTAVVVSSLTSRRSRRNEQPAAFAATTPSVPSAQASLRKA